MEEVQQRAQREQQERQERQHVSPVFRDHEVRGNGRESEKNQS